MIRAGEVGWLKSPLITYDRGYLQKDRSFLGIFKVVVLDSYGDTGLIGYQHLAMQGLPYYSNVFQVNIADNFYPLSTDRDILAKQLGFKSKKNYLDGGLKGKLLGIGNSYLHIISRFNCWIVKIGTNHILGMHLPLSVENIEQIDIRTKLDVSTQMSVSGFISNLAYENTKL